MILLIINFLRNFWKIVIMFKIIEHFRIVLLNENYKHINEVDIKISLFLHLRQTTLNRLKIFYILVCPVPYCCHHSLSFFFAGTFDYFSNGRLMVFTFRSFLSIIYVYIYTHAVY